MPKEMEKPLTSIEEEQRQIGRIGQAPRRDLSFVPIKAEVKNSVSLESKKGAMVTNNTFRALTEGKDIMNNRIFEGGRMYRTLNDSSESLFTNCAVQYAYTAKDRVYSVGVMIDKKPMIFTTRVGQNFLELSLSDRQGNVSEILRQEDGKGIRFDRVVG